MSKPIRRDLGPRLPLTDEQRALVVKWLPFAHARVRRYAATNGGLDYDDLTGAAMDALVYAAQRFDPRRAQFPQLLRLAIRQHLHREACRQWARGLGRVLSNLCNRRTSFDDLPGYVHLQAPAGGDGPETIGCLIADETAPDPTAVEDGDGTREVNAVRAAAAGLTGKKRQVIARRLAGESQARIARDFGISRSGTGKIEEAARKKLATLLGGSANGALYQGGDR